MAARRQPRRGPNRPNQGPNRPNRPNHPQAGSLRGRAVRDVMAGLRPYLEEIAFQGQQGERQTGQQLSRLGSIYGGLDTKLQQLEGGYTPQAEAISGQLRNDMGEWGKYLGSVSPAGELAQAAGLFGNIGAGALGEIGGASQRALDFNTSAQRQGAIEQMTTQRNALTDLQQLQDELRDRRMQATRDTGQQVLSRLDELRDFQTQQKLAQQELALRRAQAEFQQRLMAQQLAGTDAQRQFLIDQLNYRRFRRHP